MKSTKFYYGWKIGHFKIKFMLKIDIFAVKKNNFDHSASDLLMFVYT